MDPSFLAHEIEFFSKDIGVIAFRMVTALILGALIGLERELTGKAAGLRTNVLICLGAASFTLVSRSFFREEGPSDIARIAAQIVTGIGFLGAGTIIQARGEIRGLTTAATIWVVAAIGLAAGAGFHSLAFVTTALVLLALLVLRQIERWIAAGEEKHAYSLVITNSTAAIEKVMKALDESGVHLRGTEIERDRDHAIVKFSAQAPASRHRMLTQILTPIPGVHKIKKH